ncbi:MAG: hypothetical protein QMD10_12965 [Desulfitobacteriaceae bacterium]|nr:hypothetical protein [Desulfitobacteriaceae bacterium]
MAVKLQATVVETIDNQGHQGTVLNVKLIDGTQQIAESTWPATYGWADLSPAEKQAHVMNDAKDSLLRPNLGGRLEINYREDGPEEILVDGQAVVVEVIE